MAHISIRRTHGLDHDRALAVAKKITAELGGSYGIVSTWDGNAARIKGSGITGELVVERGRFDIDLTLGLMTMMFRDKIHAGIDAKLDELLTAKSKKSVKPVSRKR